MTRPLNAVRASQFVSIATPVFFFLLILRGWRSLDRIPADPGYGWVFRASREGLPSVVTSDPYFRLHELTVAWIVSLFPIETHALLLSLLSHVTWAVGASTVALVTLTISESRSMAMIVGFLVVLAPHASESVLGNHGNVRWILLIVLVVVVSSPPELHTRRLGIGLLALVNGLSNPIAGVCLLPLVVRGLKRRYLHPAERVVGGWLAAGALLQILRAMTNDFLGGHEQKMMMPWNDMGVFWWSGLFGPLVSAGAALLILLVGRQKATSGIQFSGWLAVLSVVTHGASYLLGGIADRYFIAPMTLSVISLVLAIHFQAFPGPHIRHILLMSVVLLVAIPASKWFSSSAYLLSGPSWSSLDNRMQVLCELSEQDEADRSPLSHDQHDQDCPGPP